jgi:hypothetical protein
MGNLNGFPTSHYMQDFDTFFTSYDDLFYFILFFHSKKGIPLAAAMAVESAQNCPKLPKFA